MDTARQRRDHWEKIHRTKGPTAVSWYAPHLDSSLRLVTEVAGPEARIIDVGGGLSTLVDDLLARGYQHLTVLDLAESALDVARARLGAAAGRVTWLAADVTEAELRAGAYDLWHDRAVFHFLQSEADRRAYVQQAERSVVRGGHVILAVFAPTGPAQCSGLQVRRYGASELSTELGRGFRLERAFEDTHRTPTGAEQRFQYARFVRV